MTTSEINSSLGIKAKEREKYLRLNSERGAIIGPHGASRFLTWQQLITDRAATPSLISIPTLEKRKGVGARASQKAKKDEDCPSSSSLSQKLKNKLLGV